MDLIFGNKNYLKIFNIITIIFQIISIIIVIILFFALIYSYFSNRYGSFFISYDYEDLIQNVDLLKYIKISVFLSCVFISLYSYQHVLKRFQKRTIYHKLLFKQKIIELLLVLYNPIIEFLTLNTTILIHVIPVCIFIFNIFDTNSFYHNFKSFIPDITHFTRLNISKPLRCLILSTYNNIFIFDLYTFDLIGKFSFDGRIFCQILTSSTKGKFIHFEGFKTITVWKYEDSPDDYDRKYEITINLNTCEVYEDCDKILWNNLLKYDDYISDDKLINNYHYIQFYKNKISVLCHEDNSIQLINNETKNLITLENPEALDNSVRPELLKYEEHFFIDEVVCVIYFKKEYIYRGNPYTVKYYNIPKDFF